MPRPDPLPGRTRPARLRGLLVALLLAAPASLGASGCASFDQDVHVSPLFSNLSMAGGGRETEALAGVVRIRRSAPDAAVRDWSVRPLVVADRFENGDSLTRFLAPLGSRSVVGDERVTQLLPLARYEAGVDEEGRGSWKFFSLPGILWSQDPTGRKVRAVFPFGGVVERSFTYDRITFVLFPLFMKTERAGRRSWHVLWPFFVWSEKEGLPVSWRVWPLYGESHSEFFDRSFWLWPLFHRHVGRPAARPGVVDRRWSFWPFFQRMRRGSTTSTSVLWPFFGFARDPQSGFWAWDGPWPLVRVQRPGSLAGVAARTRLWPFYSHFLGDGLESTWALWPIFNFRSEAYRDGRREGQNVVPFWQQWEKVDLAGEPVGSWRKLWPLWQMHTAPEASRFALPALNPLWHTPVLDDHYAWIYELYTREWDATRVRERSWGGLWRRDADAFERRTYLTLLWANRRFAFEGQRVSETSLLCGLLRWRSRDGRFDGLLRPALPGPGFPIRRGLEPLEAAP